MATARSRSASSRMISGFLPPISSCTRAWRATAAAATWAPTPCEPVNEIPSTSLCLISTSPIEPRPNSMLKTPAGAPHSCMMSASTLAVAGVGPAGLGTTGFPKGRDGDREVPGREQAEHADGLAVGLDLDAGTGAFQVLAVAAQGLASEVLEDAAGADGLADAFRQGLALFARQQAADVGAARDDGRGDLVQQVRADFRRGFRPRRERLLGRVDGGGDLGLAAHPDPGGGGAGVRRGEG